MVESGTQMTPPAKQSIELVKEEELAIEEEPINFLQQEVPAAAVEEAPEIVVEEEEVPLIADLIVASVVQRPEFIESKVDVE